MRIRSRLVLPVLMILPWFCVPAGAQEGSRIDFSGRTFLGFDSNVPLATDESSDIEGDSFNAGQQLNVGREMMKDEDTLLRAELPGAALGPFEESDFNVVTIFPVMSLRQNFQVANTPSVLNVELEVTQFCVGDDSHPIY